MITLIYLHNHKNHPNTRYTIVQQKPGDLYYFYGPRGEPIGSLAKENGKWEQIGGRQTLDDVIEGMGKLIEENM